MENTEDAYKVCKYQKQRIYFRIKAKGEEKTMKKMISILILMITFISVLQNIVLGVTELKYADLVKGNPIRTDVEFFENGIWFLIEANYVGYKESKGGYPAYCISHGKDGVEEAGNYRVNIEKLLQDVKSKDIDYIQIWRTIINGYPYKSPEELGVDSIQEAYFVTKQAIYCVMLNRSMDVYRGISEKGNRNVKAIKKLRDIGLNGAQIPPVAGLKVEKSGNWVEESENYVQTYTVKANVDISQYEVSISKGTEKGVFISDSIGNAKLSFKGNETFKVNIPKSQAKQKIDIEFTVKAKCKTYPIFYGVTTVQGTQDYAVTYSEYRRFCSKCEINC